MLGDIYDFFPKGTDKIRPIQEEILKEIETQLDMGTKFIIIEAPTGVGKSDVNVTAALYKKGGTVLTTQKILQDQYDESFNFVRSVKGKNHFPCHQKDDLENFNDKGFSKHIDINLKAPALLIKDFKKYVKNKEANIINIIDQRVKKLTPFFFSYTLSKAALATLTTTTAMKLAPNIRVNGISPGPTLKNKRQSEKHFKAQWKSTILQKQVDLNNICASVKYFIESNSITCLLYTSDAADE